MSRFLAFFLFLISLRAQEVPGLFIVEMEDGAKPGARATAASRQAFRSALEQRFEVLESVEHTLDAFIVRGAADGGGALRSAVGQTGRVFKVYEVKLDLDAALDLHRVREAWSLVGGEPEAGKGIKIAIIDTGIDWEHPGFRQTDLKAPNGFPRFSPQELSQGTSGKVIVARSYEQLVGSGESSAADVVGHGTAVAMAAGGVRNRAPFGEIAGVAPGAWLGAYKVFAANGASNTAALLKAIDDAVADGMDILNLSLGQAYMVRPELDPVGRAVERAAAAGVLVVKSAGNGGPDPWTGSSPAPASNLIAVGASFNSRTFTAGIALGEAGTLPGVASDTVAAAPVAGPLTDVGAIAESGLACGALPAGSLQGRVALIERGICDFETKLTGARRAGAIAGVVFSDDRAPGGMMTGSAGLPAIMVSRENGLRLKELLSSAPDLGVEVRFAGVPSPVEARQIAPFSSRGPNGLRTVFPDVLAAGVEIYTATQKGNAAGEIYSESGYTTVNGTSLSTPLVAGAAAVLKAKRPGMSPAQYKSLLTNSAAPLGADVPVQGAGAGLLDLSAAMGATIAADPVSIDYGFYSGVLDRDFVLTNTGVDAETFSIVVEPRIGGRGPLLDKQTITLQPFESVTIRARFEAQGLEPGVYQGVLRVIPSRGGPEARIAYSYAERTRRPARITPLISPAATPRAGSTATYLFVITESTGAPVLEPAPVVEPVTPGLTVRSVDSVDFEAPFTWLVQVVLAPEPGLNRFRVKVGELEREFTVRGR